MATLTAHDLFNVINEVFLVWSGKGASENTPDQRTRLIHLGCTHTPFSER